jgi:hypothetical protein
MQQARAYGKSVTVMTQLLCIATLHFGLAGTLAAQMTVSNTGTGGASGIQMTNGTSVSASSTQVSIWADTSTTRGKINNGGFNGGGALPIATWPCTTATGGIVWGGAAMSGIAVETCLGGNSSGTALLSENSGGTPSWVATTGTGSAVLATTPTLVTPVLGAATATSINGLIISTTTGTLTLANSKTFKVDNTLELAGTDSTKMTFPNVSGSVIVGVAGDGVVLSTTACTPSSAGVCTLSLVSTPTGTGTTLALSASPTFTGTPTLPTGTIATTQAANDNSTAIATTAYVRSQTVRLAADTGGSTSATLGSTGMTFPIAASQVLSFTCQVVVTSTSSSGGIFMGITGPTTPTNVAYQIIGAKGGQANFNSALSQASYSTTGIGLIGINTGVSLPVIFSGTLENGSTAGTLTIQFANGSGTGTAVVKRGSFCTAE